MPQHRVELLHRRLNIHVPPELDLMAPHACRCHQRSERVQHDATQMCKPSASSHSDRAATEIESAHEFNSLLERAAVPYTHVALTLPHEPTSTYCHQQRPGAGRAWPMRKCKALPPQDLAPWQLAPTMARGLHLASMSRHASPPGGLPWTSIASWTMRDLENGRSTVVWPTPDPI